MEQIQRKMIAHGALLFLVGLAAGFPFAFFILGKLTLWPIPGSVEVSLPGDLRGWRMAHLEGLLNGMMLFAVAAIFPYLQVGEKRLRAVAWSLILTGWGNCLASIIGPVFSGRGLEFGQGWSNTLMYLLFMAAVFAVIYAMVVVYRAASR